MGTGIEEELLIGCESCEDFAFARRCSQLPPALHEQQTVGVGWGGTRGPGKRWL